MVTILLATLNGEDYLKAQLESIAAQTYENWQLVVEEPLRIDENGSGSCKGGRYPEDGAGE